jgi:hypothetical protein
LVIYNFQARPGNQCPEALPRLLVGKLEAEPPDMRYQAEPVNEQTGSQAKPGNQCPEALPRLLVGKLEAEPPDMRYQAEPVNE